MIETKLDGKTPDIAEENIAKLKEIFPDVFCEGKVDFEKLRQVLGNYIEDEDERYNFSWNGKGRSLRLAQSPSTGTLRPCKEESKDWDTTENLYIEGDNLEVLKLLQKSYHGKIKMIYIDPPYNTGHDFVYPDDYTDNMQNYLELTGQVDSEGKKITTNPDTNGRYHTDWLNMMYPRLRLARNLLADDGVIFISIDDNEQANLKKICDEVFGEGNFVVSLVWQKKTGASDAKAIATITEYLLVYTKSEKGIYSFEKNKGSYDLTRYKYTDEFVEERGPYYIDNLDRGGLSYSDSLNYGIECPDGAIVYPNGRSNYLNDGWIWKWGKEKIEWARKNKFIEFRKSNSKESGWSVCYKNYLKVDNDNKPIDRAAPYKNLITNILNANAAMSMKELFDTNNYFNYSKPIELIKLIVSFIKIDKKSIILDFFSGSATTAHAVMQLNAEDGGNRKFICVQLPEPTDEKSEAYKAGYKNICEIGKERIRRAGEKNNTEIIESNKQIALDEEEKKFVDVGFKVFKLDTSNIKKWNPDFDNLEDSFVDSVNNLVDGRSELDLVYEIMLKYGLDLTYPVEELSYGDKKIYSIAFGMLVICVAEDVSKDIADFIVEYKKQNNIEEMRTVFKDGCFKDDSTQMSIKETLKSAGIEEFITI